MPQDYLYDVFISYRHEPPVLDWLNNHFYELLSRWLPSTLHAAPKIFIDTQVEKGAVWPAALREALKMSRCLLTIWSPEYFRSHWCLAEWKSMQKREKLLRLNPARAGLIYPVVFSGDKELFPPRALETQHKDLRQWNTPEPVLRSSVEWIAFDKEVQNLCRDLARIIQRAPAWRRNWPVETPRAAQNVAVRLPRL
jgi:TIR domain